MVGRPRCTCPSIHFFVSRSRSVARRARVQAFVCVCAVSGVWCVMCGVWWCVCGVCACSVVVCIVHGGVWCVAQCVVRVGCAFCVSVSLCVCVRGVCCVCAVWCVARPGTRKTPVCRFKTSPCVGSKRLCVCRHHAHMLKNMCAVCQSWRRFEPTHGGVLNLHTGGALSLSPFLCLSLPSSSVPSFSSFVLFLFSLLVSLFFSVSSQLSVFLFSMTMTMIARPVGSLCTHGSDLP